MELQQQPPRQPDGCLTVAIRLPVRIVVLVLVVPVRLLWDAVAATGRAVHRTVLRPVGRALAWLGRTLVVVPLTYTLRALGRAVRVLVLTPLGWLWRYGVAVPAVWLHRHLLAPLGRGIARVGRGAGRAVAAVWTGLMWVLSGVWAGLVWVLSGVWAGAARLGSGVWAAVAWLGTGMGIGLGWAGTRLWAGLAWCGRGIGAVLSVVGTVLVRVGLILFVVPVGWFCRRVLMPVGHAVAVVAREIGAAFGHAWRIAGHLSRAIGRGLKWLGWQLVGRPLRWVWRTLCAPVLHWARRALWAPAARAAVLAGRAARDTLSGAARTAREALASARESVRQARADAWRALVGGPRREPAPLTTRTLGSTTTASGAVPAPEISLSRTEG
ncbi:MULTISPECIES: hypothetical protein [unclassified Streptomyces]|uniref:hypothetical protein n=1 Tax=unclassified Streptomyces TaxID=2593676 RepID=UPI0033FFF4A3